MLGILLLVAITFAFIQGGRNGAGSTEVIGAGIVAVVLAGLFVLAEHRRGAEAMLPLGLFRRAAFAVANGAAGTMNLCTLGTIFVLTLFLQSVQHHSALSAGLEMIPLFAPLAIIAPLAGRLTSRIGARLPIAAGLIIAGAGLGILVLAEPRSGYLTLLRDDGEGRAKWIDRHVEDLNRPYGLAWRDDGLLVADQDGIWRVPHNVGALFNLGVIYTDFLKRPDDGRPLFKRFLTDAPGDHPSRSEAERYLAAAPAPVVKPPVAHPPAGKK